MASNQSKSKMRNIKGKKWGTEMKRRENADLMFPTLSIELEHLPEARGWKNGNDYIINLRVRQRSIREDETGGNVGFDIVGVEVPKKQPKPRKKEKVRRYT